MAAALGGEKGSVQNPMVKYAKDIGWTYVSQEDALTLRGGETGLVFRDIFIEQIKKLNPSFMDHGLAQDLIKRLEQIPPTIEGNFTAWEHLRGLKTVFVPTEKRERNVQFVDRDKIGNNLFHVTDEFSFTNGTKKIRLDAAFLINGVPVVFSETKAAHKIEGISEALDQVRKYHQHCPELISILQLYALTHIIKYYYSTTWNTSMKWVFNWKEECQGNYETLVKTFLDKTRIIKILTDFILFTRQDDELKKEDLEAVRKLRGFPHQPFFRLHKGNGAAKPGDGFGKGLLYDTWKRACRNLGIEGVDLYGGTRHSSAQALRDHMTREEVKELTGHHTSACFSRYFWADLETLRSGYQKARRA